MDSQFQNPLVLKAIEDIRRKPSLQISELSAKSIKGRNVEYSESGVVPIIRSGDVSQFPNKNAYLLAEKSEPIHYLKSGDVLISSIGFGSIGKVQLFDSEHEFGAVGEITIIRQRKIKPAFLASFLASKFGQMQIERWITGATGQLHLYPSDVDQIYLPFFGDEFQNATVKAYKLASVQFDSSLEFERTANSLLMSALGLADWKPPEPLSYVASSANAFAAGRLDAQFFAPRIRGLIDHLSRSGSTIGSVSAPRRQKFNTDLRDVFNYIEIGNLGSAGITGSSRLQCDEAPSRATWHARTDDIITSMVRPIRRLSAQILPEQDGYVCSSGFVVLEPLQIQPEVLLTFLRLPAICELMDLYASASMYPAISEADILALPFPTIDNATAEAICLSVQQSRKARQRATFLLDRAKRAVEIAIEDSEAAALQYLEEAGA